MKYTFTLWNYKDYKESIKNSNQYNKEEYKRTKESIKRRIESLRQEIKELQAYKKPIVRKATREDFIKTIERQREQAKQHDWVIIENKDTKGLKCS